MNQETQAKDPTEQKWAAAMHVSALAGILLPLALVLGPFLVWMLKKHESNYLDMQGKKAINFQLTVLLLAFVMALVATLIKPILALVVMIVIGGLVFAIMAAVMVYKKGDFNYPFSLKIVK